MDRPQKTDQECFGEAKKLIAEAVAETDDTRRTALLVLADHWVALQAARRGQVIGHNDTDGAQATA